MLRPQIVSFLRHDTPALISALFNNLHTSQISAAVKKRKRNKGRACVSVAVILCGCGRYDGTEITEAISAAIHLHQKDMKPMFYAPDIELRGVVNHLTKQADTVCPSKNALVEGARLARGCIQSICECDVCTHGGLIIPGGFGAARTLSNFTEKGTDCTVLPDLEKLIIDFYCEKKVIGTMCIASALVAKVLKGVTVTLGKESPKDDWPYADAIKKVKAMGAQVELKDVKGVTRCSKYNVISTPAWLYQPATYAEIHEGIGNLVTMLKKCMTIK